MTEVRRTNCALTVIAVLAFTSAGAAQHPGYSISKAAGASIAQTAENQHKKQHKGHEHKSDRLEEVNKRGDTAMGFSQAKTTHHFRLFKDGGAIEVEANDPEDLTSRNQIRQHLTHTAEAFSAGDFSIPHAVHAEAPPGVAVMTRLKDLIKYKYEPMKEGGRVRISTADPQALAAIHEFLRYQIKDHQTGDSLEVSR